MSALKSDLPTFALLPAAARAYVAAVVVLGAACLVAAAANLRFEHPGLFVALLGLAIGTSAAKIELPLGRSHSNLSLSHAVNFWALFALGPAEAVCIASVSAWAQCTLRAGGRNPTHRIVFSMGSLTLTITAAAVPVVLMMGSGVPATATLLRTAAVVAPLYFFVNTGLVAVIDRALDASADGAGLAAQLPVERAELSGRRGARGLRHGGVGPRLVRMARAARGPALPGLPKRPRRGLAAAGRAG